MSAEITGRSGVGPCEQCGRTEGVLLLRMDLNTVNHIAEAYFCVICIADAVDEALGWKTRNMFIYALLSKRLSDEMRPTRRRRGGAKVRPA